MMLSVLILLFGLLLIAFGLYYFQKEKSSPESRRIYGITIVIGIALLAAGAASLLL